MARVRWMRIRKLVCRPVVYCTGSTVGANVRSTRRGLHDLKSRVAGDPDAPLAVTTRFGPCSKDACRTPRSAGYPPETPWPGRRRRAPERGRAAPWPRRATARPAPADHEVLVEHQNLLVTGAVVTGIDTQPDLDLHVISARVFHNSQRGKPGPRACVAQHGFRAPNEVKEQPVCFPEHRTPTRERLHQSRRRRDRRPPAPRRHRLRPVQGALQGPRA